MEEKEKSKHAQIIEAWVEMLKKHHRDLEWKRISKSLNDRIDAMQTVAEVTVADEKGKSKIAGFLERKNVPAEVTVDQKILGGVKIVWDNLMIDNSINSQLDKLKKSLQ